MLSVEQCERYLRDKSLSKERIEVIRDYLYALCEEVIKQSIEQYEQEEAKNIQLFVGKGANTR